MLEGFMAYRIGYKSFEIDADNELFSAGRVYRLGEMAETRGVFNSPKKGMSFCWHINDLSKFYNAPDAVICTVEILGEIINKPDHSESYTNMLRILNALTKEEIFVLSNSSRGNVGFLNTGSRNKGDQNAGSRNNGSFNSGELNIGGGNSGSRNSGNRNSGNRNTGDWNTGNWNTGGRNAGSRNIGEKNTGDWNEGEKNSGNRNYGDRNSGNRNYGDRNSGNRNSGNRNSGNYNNGNFNAGSWNDGNNNIGIFNTGSPALFAFNKPIDLSYEELNEHEAVLMLRYCRFPLTEWVEYTPEEKAWDKAKQLTGGYFKKNSYKSAWKKCWEDLSLEQKQLVQTLPNFDPVIFTQITGIDCFDT